MAAPTLVLEFAPGVDVDTNPTDPDDWVAITGKARSVTFKRGRSSERDQFRPGTMTVVLGNADRLFDPNYSAGTHFGDLVPRVHVRLYATWDSTDYPLFQGFISGWPQEWQVADTDATCTIQCYDAMGVLATSELRSVWEHDMETLTPDAWFRLDETSGDVMADSSGNANDGLWFNNATASKGPALIFGDDAPSFKSPAGSTVTEIPYGYAAGYTRGDSLPHSIVAWVQWAPDRAAEIASDSFEQAVVFIAFTEDGVTTTMSVSFNQTGDSHAVQGVVFRPAGGGAIVSETGLVLEVARTRGDRPHMIAIVVPASGDFLLYLDGVEVDTSTPSGSSFGVPGVGFLIGATDAVIGGLGSSGEAAFNGSVSDVASFTSELSAANVLTLWDAGNAPWDGDKTGARIQRILDAINWPAGLTDLDTGRSVLGPATINGKTALSVMQAIETTEQGYLYVSADGKVTFLDRDALITDTRTTVSQATFSDDTTSGQQSRILKGDFDEDLIVNQSVVTDANGIRHQVDDTTSQASFGVRTESLKVGSSRGGLNLAEHRVNDYKDPHFRVPSVHVFPMKDDALWPKVLGRELGDLVTVKRTPQGVGSLYTDDLVVEGIEWKIRPGDKWAVEFRLGRPLSTTPRWVLGTAQLATDTTLFF